MSEFPLPLLSAVREGQMGKTVVLILNREGQEAERLTVTRAAYEQNGAPAVGEILDENTYHTLKHASDLRRAVGTALHILEYGDTTRTRLREKLATRGFAADIADAAVLEMVRRGYIDEARTAARQAVLCAEKGWGRRKVHAWLVQHGIPSDTATDAIQKAEESGEIDFAALRRNFISVRRARGMEDAAIRRALWRAGF